MRKSDSPPEGWHQRHQLAADRALDDISVCLWPGAAPSVRYKRQKTINMELDTGPTAPKVPDSPLLRPVSEAAVTQTRLPDWNRPLTGRHITRGFSLRAPVHMDCCVFVTGQTSWRKRWIRGRKFLNNAHAQNAHTQKFGPNSIC